MSMDLSIILSVGRQNENLANLISRIHAVMCDNGLECELVLVGNHIEQTCRELPENLSIVNLTNKPAQMNAFIYGMQYARGEVIVAMDHNLTHPPEKIPELIESIRNGDADLVIGSRYVAGGGFERDPGLLRRIKSIINSLLTRPLTPVKDPASGFLALRKSTFDQAHNLDEQCPNLGLELSVKCARWRIEEMPFMAGVPESKHNRAERRRFDYIRHLKRLYEYKLGAIAKPLQFVIVGSTGLIVDLICYLLLLSVLPIYVARALAIWVAMTSNFWLNRRITFSFARNRRLLPQYFLFCSSCLVGAVVNWAVSIGLYNSIEFFTNAPLLAAFCGVVAGTGFNYAFSARVVFRRNRQATHPLPAAHEDSHLPRLVEPVQCGDAGETQVRS